MPDVCKPTLQFFMTWGLDLHYKIICPAEWKKYVSENPTIKRTNIDNSRWITYFSLLLFTGTHLLTCGKTAVKLINIKYHNNHKIIELVWIEVWEAADKVSPASIWSLLTAEEEEEIQMRWSSLWYPDYLRSTWLTHFSLASLSLFLGSTFVCEVSLCILAAAVAAAVATAAG